VAYNCDKGIHAVNLVVTIRLTIEQRREIAQRAAEARWPLPGPDNQEKATQTVLEQAALFSEAWATGI